MDTIALRSKYRQEIKKKDMQMVQKDTDISQAK